MARRGRPHLGGQKAYSVQSVRNRQRYISVQRRRHTHAEGVQLQFRQPDGISYKLVNSGGTWDIKRKASWESTIDTVFPGSYKTPITYCGMQMTPESLGNYAYGYLGAAFGFSYNTLINGSAGATFIKGRLNKYEGVVNETGDWYYIMMGYLDYYLMSTEQTHFFVERFDI